MNSDSVSLTVQQVRQLADGSSYVRGVNYYEHGAIYNPIRQGRELRGECRGSQRQPYRVRVILGECGVEEAWCDCPRGGFCKHIVALLLKYVHEPDAFEAASSLNIVLARLGKEELIALIEDLVQREPALASVVVLAADAARGQTLDATALQRELNRALNQDDPSDIEADLRHILHVGERLAEHEAWSGAGAVYHAVLDGLTDCYKHTLHGMDDDGEFRCIAQDCVEGLAQCLESCAVNPEARRKWLVAILGATLADIELGGIEYAYGAWGVILEHADEEDWTVLQASIRERIPSKNAWKQSVLVRMLADWEERYGRHENARQLIRELGTIEQQVYLKIEEGQPDDAVVLIKRHLQDSPGLIKKMADTLDKAGAGAYAVQLLTELADAKRSHPCYLEWLVAFHRRRGQPDAAFAWQRRLFQQSPTFESFTMLRQIGEPLGLWPQARLEALQVAEKKKYIGLLIEIALDEQDVASALALLPKLTYYGRHDYRDKVARAAETTHPREAIGVYREMAETIIRQRARNQYGQAVDLLCRMRDLWLRLDDGTAWLSYTAALKRSCARLPALLDELRKRGL